jgi:hypothetical protein
MIANHRMNVKLDKWGAQGGFLGSWVATGYEFEELYGDGTLGSASVPVTRSEKQGHMAYAYVADGFGPQSGCGTSKKGESGQPPSVRFVVTWCWLVPSAFIS